MEFPAVLNIAASLIIATLRAAISSPPLCFALAADTSGIFLVVSRENGNAERMMETCNGEREQTREN